MAVPCWSSWKAGLDVEALGGGDVLQVDAAVGRGDGLDDGDDLLGVLRVQGHRPGVHVAELLEQNGLALHDGHGCGRADVPQPQDRGPVGDDGDRVLLDGEHPGALGVVVDGLADAGHSGGVDAGQVTTVVNRVLASDLDLASDVSQEGRVADVADDDAVDLLQLGNQLVAVLGVPGVRSEIDGELVAVGIGHVDAGDDGTSRSGSVDQAGHRLLGGGYLEVQGDGVTGTGLNHGHSSWDGRDLRSVLRAYLSPTASHSDDGPIVTGC